jgi:Na+/H+-translocating membrane pyrophosphatase
MLYPLVLSALGIVASILGTFFVKATTRASCRRRCSAA